MSFDGALVDSSQYKKRNLLLGNGFSIACKPNIFRYDALYEQANFSRTPEIETIFNLLSTYDFEVVIRALENSALILPAYFDNNEVIEKLKKHADLIKELLINTIAGNHPSFPSEVPDREFWACRQFLENFLSPENDGRVYTVNYDLLLYWALMHEDNPSSNPVGIITNDGFGEDLDAEDADYVVWKSESNSSQKIFYLHGALHLFDAGTELKKYTWNRCGEPLISQVRSAISKNMYPLFVSEGTSEQKLEKIRHHAYLQHAFKSFSTIVDMANQSLFIHGHSLADNDQHLLKKIGRGKTPCIYISLFGNPDEPWNRSIVNNANKIAAMRSSRYPLSLCFYDAQSIKVWN